MTVSDRPSGEERSVFVEPYDIERDGHIGQFHSDKQRFSFCYCSCGWSNDTTTAEGIIDLWRAHFGSRVHGGAS